MISKLSMNLYGLDSNSNTHQQRQFKTKEEIYYAKYHTRQKNGLVLSQSPVLYKPLPLKIYREELYISPTGGPIISNSSSASIANLLEKPGGFILTKNKEYIKYPQQFTVINSKDINKDNNLNNNDYISTTNAITRIRRKLGVVNNKRQIPVKVNSCLSNVINNNCIITQPEDLEIIRGCTEIIGNVIISGFNFQPDFSVFECLITIKGYFRIVNNEGITEIYGFNNLRSINGVFDINNNDSLNSISGFTNLRTIDGYFNISNNIKLNTLSKFQTLYSIKYFFNIDNNISLTRIYGFNNLNSIGKYFNINNNTFLQYIYGFNNLNSIGEYFDINNNNSLITICGFNNLNTIDGYFSIHDNILLNIIPKFTQLVKVNSFFDINNINIKNICGFENLNEVFIYINYNALLKSISGFEIQENIELINNNINLIISNNTFNNVILYKIDIPYYNGYISFNNN